METADVQLGVVLTDFWEDLENKFDVMIPKNYSIGASGIGWHIESSTF